MFRMPRKSKKEVPLSAPSSFSSKKECKPEIVQKCDLGIHVETKITKTLVDSQFQDVGCISGSSKDTLVNQGPLYKAIRVESVMVAKGTEEVLMRIPEGRVIEELIMDFFKRKLLPKSKVI